MATTNNKVKFGLKNVHYAVATSTFDESTGKWSTTYGTPKALAGAVSISLSKEVAKNIFYADDMAYFTTRANNGYTGSYELAQVPATALVDIWGQVRDNNGLLVESTEDVHKEVALMFEITGDVKATKYCFFRVDMDKPNVEGDTKGESVEVKTDSIDLTILPRLDDGAIKCRADEDTDTQAYNSFYSAVPAIEFATV